MRKMLLPLALFSIVGCNNNDDVPNIDASLIGRWTISKAEVYRSTTQQTSIEQSTGCNAKSTHEFQEKTMISTTYGLKDNVCAPLEAVVKDYTYDKATKNFWYKGEADYPYIISKLTQKEMVMEDHMEDIDSDGIKDVVKRFFTRIN